MLNFLAYSTGIHALEKVRYGQIILL